jgi:hypothetical protein
MENCYRYAQGPKMKPTKRKAPRSQRDTEFCNQIPDLSKIRDSHYLLVKLKEPNGVANGKHRTSMNSPQFFGICVSRGFLTRSELCIDFILVKV